MSARLTTGEFIQKSINIHGDRYDYSLVVYNSRSTKVDIVCKIHGVFSQTAGDHLQKYGCPICGGTKLKTLDEFVTQANDIHLHKYNYNHAIYINTSQDLVVTCAIHGNFLITPKEHLAGHGCKFCGYIPHQIINADRKAKAAINFITNSKIIHKNKYDYSIVCYNGAHEKVQIICPTHGIFTQTPNNHIRDKNGCPICYMESDRLGCYTKDFFVKYPDIAKSDGLLYFVDFKNTEDHFVKIGITKHNIQTRFTSKEYKKYDITPIYQKIGPLSQIFDEEQFLIKKYKHYKHVPPTPFGGRRECFCYDINIIRDIQEYFI